MTETCPHLRELDAWFSLALDLLGSEPAVRRDVLLLVGGAGRLDDVVRVRRDDCEEFAGHLFAFPPDASGHSLPLTPGFLEVTELTAADWPAEREDPRADADAVEATIATIDGALARIGGAVRAGGPERLRELRMHAWLHELGDHVGVLARCYGAELTALLNACGGCPATRYEREVALVPHPRRARVDAIA
jgi:hypothetical protein